MEDNFSLPEEKVIRIADAFEDNDKREKEYRKDLEKQVKEINQKILDSMQKRMPYRLLYKPEYGDYREYVDKVSKELRRRAG